MSTTKSFAGGSYALPNNREPKGWGTAVSNFLIAVADNAIPKTGGSYSLSAELNLGSSYGLLAPYLKSAAANIASAGVLRLAKTDVVAWRNNANGADVSLGLSASDRVQVGSAAVLLATDTLAAHAATTSAQLASVISDETGTGALVFATSPTLVTPNLGTPASGNLANCTFPTLNQNTTGTAGGLSATLAIGSGGTGQTTAAAAFKAFAQYASKGDIPGYNGTTTGVVSVGSDGTVLTADAASTYGLKWSTPLTNPMTAVGDLIIGGSSGAATALSGNTAAARKFLTQTGTGSASAAPVWAENFVTANVRASEGAGTTTLVNTDGHWQVFNLSANRTVQLPTTNVKAGDTWLIENRANFELTIQSSGTNTIETITVGRCRLVAIADTPTTALNWLVMEVYEASTFTGTMTGGYSVLPSTQTYYFTREGGVGLGSTQSKIITVTAPGQTGTANAATNPTISGAPARLFSSTSGVTSSAGLVQSGGTNILGFLFATSSGNYQLLTSTQGSNGFTASGAKGTVGPLTFTYRLID